MKITLMSPKVNCEGCRKTITKTLKHLKGVKSVEVNLETKEVLVDYDAQKIQPEMFLTKLAEINYPSTIKGA